MARCPDALRRELGRAGLACLLVSAWPGLHAAVPANDGAAARERELDAQRRDATRAALCSSAIPGGTGLSGEFFSSEGLRGTRLAERLQTELEWPTGLAARSARWIGWLRAPLTGFYAFHARVPGVQITVAGRRVGGEGAAPQARVELAAGRFHPILIELPRIDPALKDLRLEWTAPHGARFAIPGRAMYPPTERVGG
jgi:hypothetical protein